ncbi:MAG: DUF2141 domain-containing protein [Pseudomonadota bacterium]
MQNYSWSGWLRRVIFGAGGSLLGLLAVTGNASAADGDFDFEHVSCTGAENEIRVIVRDVKKSVGLITADLYSNNNETFLRGGEGRVKKVKYAARAPVTRFCITTPESGDFAMAVYHDRNANGKFDKTGLGLPDEPWGISNNPKVRFAAPHVERALFQVSEAGATVDIKLN